MASASSIYRNNIKRWNGRITPASLHGCRVAIKDDNSYFVASGNEVLILQPTFPEPNANDAAALSKTGLPVPIPVSQMNEELFPTPHIHEIHSIVYDEPNNDPALGRLGCIDGYGCATITPVNNTNTPKSIVLNPVNARAGDSGWAGIAFNPKNFNSVVTSHLPSKAITIYDIQAPGGPKATKILHGLNSPTGVKVMDDGNTLLSLEYNQLAIYGACEKRLVASTTWLYGMGIGEGTQKNGKSPVVAVGGASRTLSVFDSRKWTVCASWANCLKHSIRTIDFSRAHKDLVYVGGIDAEVIAGKWEGGGTASHFTCLRVDARWVGLHAGSHKDMLFGTTATGTAYWVKDPAFMYDRAKDAQAQLARHPHPLTSAEEGFEGSEVKRKRVDVDVDVEKSA